MGGTQRVIVVGKGGWRGTIEALPVTADPGTRVDVTLENGEHVSVPADLLLPRPDGTAYLPLAESDLRTNGRQELVVPVVQEQVTVGKRTEESGSVVVHVTPRTTTEVVDVPLAEEHAEVERVPVNRFVPGPVPVRQEGDVTIVPVYEEVLVVERRLMLKEEIHVRRRQQTRVERQEVALRTEEVRVMRSGDRP